VFTDGLLANARSRRGLVVDNLLAEAFANAVEALASAFADDLDDIFALAINSYVSFNPSLVDAIRRVGAEFGEAAVLGVLFAAFSRVNFGHRAVATAEIRECASLTLSRQRVSRANMDAVAAILRFALRLNPDFLDNTTQAYFRTLGISGDHLRYVPSDGFRAKRVAERFTDGAGTLAKMLGLNS
jgi:hypothetical protein